MIRYFVLNLGLYGSIRSTKVICTKIYSIVKRMSLRIYPPTPPPMKFNEMPLTIVNSINIKQKTLLKSIPLVAFHLNNFHPLSLSLLFLVAEIKVASLFSTINFQRTQVSLQKTIILQSIAFQVSNYQISTTF